MTTEDAGLNQSAEKTKNMTEEVNANAFLDVGKTPKEDALLKKSASKTNKTTSMENANASALVGEINTEYV